MHSHFAAYMGQELQAVALIHFYSEARVRKVLDHGAFEFDALFLFGLGLLGFAVVVLSGHIGIRSIVAHCGPAKFI